MKRTSDNIDTLEVLRAKGYTWSQCAKQMSDMQGEDITIDAAKHAVYDREVKYGDGQTEEQVVRTAVRNRFKSQQVAAGSRKFVKAVGRYESWKDEVLA